jgi:hypothetical protein
MSEILKATTTDVIKAKFGIALMRAELGIQRLHNKRSVLVFNEDHLEDMAEFIGECKKAKAIIEEEHQKEKEPYLKQSQAIDQSRREMIAEINSVMDTVNIEYTKLCRQIEARKKIEADELNRVSSIRNGIKENVLFLSTQIASCKTLKELTQVQTKINFIKGAPQSKAKYQEFYPEIVELLDGLNDQVNQQKERIKEIEALKKKAAKADESEKVEIEQRIEDIHESINETNINIQEEAVGTATSPSVQAATEVFPEIKVKRSVWKWEVTDIAKLQKTMPQLVKTVPNDDAIKAMWDAIKTNPLYANKDEVLWNGIKFTLEKRFA